MTLTNGEVARRIRLLGQSTLTKDRKLAAKLLKLQEKRARLFEGLLAYGDVESLRRFLNDQGFNPSVHMNDDGVWVEQMSMRWDSTRLGDGTTVREALTDFIRNNFTPKGYPR